MTAYHLAQLNIARPRGPLDGPLMADFMSRLEEINALADAAPGFVWRLVGEGGADATALRPYGPDVMVNLSLWESVEALYDFTYRTAHLDVLRRRREWFHHDDLPAYAVLWWVPAGTIPTLEEAHERLTMLASDGPTARAFTYRAPFPAPATSPTGEPANA
ncbi:DUF3291 domain-containing protein [Rugosimonospora acidiphila]|uniref:DUF3291 domain-containing protein n=1 Tax=Rugosimonospora acidiphila TaxID=556531 RepID=A0ABP9S533_9ACTN